MKIKQRFTSFFSYLSQPTLWNPIKFFGLALIIYLIVIFGWASEPTILTLEEKQALFEKTYYIQIEAVITTVLSQMPEGASITEEFITLLSQPSVLFFKLKSDEIFLQLPFLNKEEILFYARRLAAEYFWLLNFPIGRMFDGYYGYIGSLQVSITPEIDAAAREFLLKLLLNPDVFIKLLVTDEEELLIGLGYVFGKLFVYSFQAVYGQKLTP